MVKIVHLSDTHVSHRRFKNVKDSWKINNRLTWIEEDYCKGFHKAMEKAAEIKPDYVVHSGDLFDVPVGRNLVGPTEYSRAFVIKVLREFFEKTENKVPFITIDGNHGTYLTRNYSTLEFLKEAFPKMFFLATNYHLKQAIFDNNPLIIEFDDVKFYLFPYLKFGNLQSLEDSYENWVRNNQEPDNSKISIAVAHGMTRGIDLLNLIFQYDYDYVALGHDHKQQRIKKNMWQAGSTEKYTFAERNQQKGFLEVDIQKGKDPIIIQKNIDSKRTMIQKNIKLTTDSSVIDLESSVYEILKDFEQPFNGETASRLKITFEGTIFLKDWWRMEDKLDDIRSKTFSAKYNILEFRWDAKDLVRTAPTSLKKGAKIKEYLIDDPVKDFERYIRDLNLDNQELAKVFIEKGAKIIEEVFSVPEHSTESED